MLRGVFTKDEVVAALQAARRDLACARERATDTKDKLIVSAAKFQQV